LVATWLCHFRDAYERRKARTAGAVARLPCSTYGGQAPTIDPRIHEGALLVVR